MSGMETPMVCHTALQVFNSDRDEFLSDATRGHGWLGVVVVVRKPTTWEPAPAAYMGRSANHPSAAHERAVG